jgi:glycogen debranching enzyme
MPHTVPEMPLEDVRRFEGEYYILATSALADDLDRVLKHGDTFAIFDHYGDVKPVGLREEGIYHHDTRHLSSFILKLGRKRPLVLSSMVERDNAQLVVDLTNPDMTIDDGQLIPRGTIHLHRTRFLWNATCYEQITVRNYSDRTLKLDLQLFADADFADVFEVRGARRKRRGSMRPLQSADGAIIFTYEGLDGVLRRTRLTTDPTADRLDGPTMNFELTLEPRVSREIHLQIDCESGPTSSTAPPLPTARQIAQSAVQHAEGQWTSVRTSNERFNEWINRSNADLRMMLAQTEHGPYPHAGVPWFSTPFGRDGVITAMQCLWVNPEMARGVLSFLAATQAIEDDDSADAEPGKMIHEIRRGEMAATGEVPFARYYGSVDVTPLFVMLAGAWYRRTGDLAFIERLWPAIERAMWWIDERSDVDGDGFAEAVKRSPNGLDQQGWKDSHDSVFHADGSPAEGPVALCEVQAYIYAARRAAADLAGALGHLDRAAEFSQRADDLRRRFEDVFWRDELGTYALALDADKKLCLVRTSNAGHCLFAGIASPDRARRCAATLLDEHGWSGWGVRTLASSENRYNPMSYHNGSIWPHDNAIVAAGFARYGLKDEAMRVGAGIFDVSLFVHLNRLPELFCGFPRRAGAGPTLYPVACSPQAWAAGSVHMLLAATLGLEIDTPQRTLRFIEPRLPPFLEQVEITGLRVGDATVDLRLSRGADDVSMRVLSRTGDVKIMIVK